MKLSRNLYDEAVCCHQRAAGYLKEAIDQLLPSSIALESLTLQLDYHVRQQNIVREFQRRRELCAKRSHPTPDEQCAVRELSKASPVDAAVDYSATTCREFDTLIQCLDICDGRSSDSRIPAPNFPYQSASKFAKDDRMKFEEQRSMNESLRSHVIALIDDNDKLRRKVEKSERRGRDLRQRLLSASANPMVDSCVVRHDVDDSSFDLPPLEVPQFDFDLLSTTVTFANTRIMDGNGP